MRSVHLTTLLMVLNVGLLLLAVAGVAVAAVRLLRQLADEQALARVEHSALGARNAVSRYAEELQTNAHVLAGRPTLAHLLNTGGAQPSLLPYLARFQEASRVDGSAVLLEGRVVGSSGTPLDWAGIHQAYGQPACSFRALPEGGLILVAWAESTGPPRAQVGMMLRVNEAFERKVSAEVGLPVAVVGPSSWPPTDPTAALRTRALESQAPLSAHLDAPGRYVGLVPLRAPTGEAAVLIETVLSADEVTRSVQQLVGTLLGLTFAVAGVAALASFLLGSRLRRPLQALTRAAGRIGQGDLQTPIQTVGGAEMATLTTTLDEMRRSLLRLTADLRRQRAESDAIVTGIAEGVFTVDRERRLQYLNPQAAALLGVNESALGRFCGDVLNPQGGAQGRPCEDRCPILHARFQPGARAAEHLRLADGRRRTVVITSAAPADEPGGSGLFRQMQVMRDETDIESARRARDTVLATISHEFKTPLSAQLASIELLLDELPNLGTDQIGELVLSLQRGTLRLTQLIDNLLESVRIEAGQFALRLRTISLDEVLEQALEWTRPLLDQRGQEAVVELPYPFPAVSGDAARLTQVFVNLLANANKFAPPRTAIRIGGSIGEDTVRLWVEDSGPGLPPSQALFAPFVRSAAAEEEPEARGVGLGLWIVKSIIERHGGRVEARSGEGARIDLILPRGDVHEDTGG